MANRLVVLAVTCGLLGSPAIAAPLKTPFEAYKEQAANFGRDMALVSLIRSCGIRDDYWTQRVQSNVIGFYRGNPANAATRKTLTPQQIDEAWAAYKRENRETYEYYVGKDFIAACRRLAALPLVDRFDDMAIGR